MYQALYRKWRPRTFDDVVGQAHITETLKHQVSTDRLSHAYLFIGTRGTGKTTCAKILAKAVNCEHPVNGNPCNTCRICRGIDDGSILDVVEMDAASNNGVDNVRQLRDEAIFSPASAKKRVYIIDEVHMLSASAFNALLKILEEPPEHLMFILATTELNKVPATILSRCQRHSFKRLDSASVVNRLCFVAQQEHIDLSPEAAELIAGLSEGGMRDALSMLDQCSGRERIDTETVYSALGLAGNRETARLLTAIAQHDSADAIARFEALWQGGKDPATLLGELSGLMRDLLMRAVAPKGGRELLSGGYDDALLDSFRQSFSVGTLVNDIGIVQTALGEMRSGQARTVCELALITLCEPGLSDTLPALRERVSALEALLRGGVPAPVQAAPPEASGAPARPSVPAPPPLTEEDVPPFDLPSVPIPAPVRETQTPAEQNTPVPAAVPAAAAAPAGDASGGDGTLWDRMREHVSGRFPVGIAAILSDPMQVSGSCDGADTLYLAIQPGFASNMVDRPDVTAKLTELAAELSGRPMKIVTCAPGAVPKTAEAKSAAPASKLDELGKFEIVKFI